MDVEQALSGRSFWRLHVRGGHELALAANTGSPEFTGTAPIDDLTVGPEHVVSAARAKRGSHLPVVLSVLETAAVLGALRGTPWLMAALIYGGGLRVSECCELRVKDVDFDQGLLFVRGGKGNKDRSTAQSS